jgi:hypothetical protein
MYLPAFTGDKPKLGLSEIINMSVGFFGSIKMDRFAESTGGFTKAYDVATGVVFNVEQTLTVGGNYLMVMELKK